MEFKSKVDKWILAVFAISIGIAVNALLPVLKSSEPSDWLLAIAVLLLVAGLPLWMLSSTLYTVADGQLKIRCGPMKWSIAVEQIQSIEPSRSLWSSPALSLDRLKLNYGSSKSILVSPKEKAKFIKALGHAE